METNAYFTDVINAIKQQEKCEADLEVAQNLAEAKKELFMIFLLARFARAVEAYNKVISIQFDNEVYKLVVDDITSTIDWNKEVFTLVIKLHDKDGKEPFMKLDRLTHSPIDIFWNFEPIITEELERDKIPLTCIGVSIPFSYYSF